MARKEPYGPVVGGLIFPERTMSLGPGAPHRAVYDSLKALTPERLINGRVVNDVDMARCAIAGLWLYHDFLDESHVISQEIGTRTGSYWHGIMHRREPDYSNAKYWFRRVGDHPVFARLQGIGAEAGLGAKWDPFGFVDLCERAAREGGALEAECRRIQMIEWKELFDYCFRGAIGEASA